MIVVDLGGHRDAVREPQSATVTARLVADPDRVISVASYIEAGTVLAGRRRSDRLRAIDDLETFLSTAGIELAPADAARAARTHQLWAGMSHGGVFNFGDTFSYAPAKAHSARGRRGNGWGVPFS